MERSRIANERSFPQVSLPSASGGRGVEVALIAQLDPGAGDAVASRASERQRHHPAHHDALDEPSALLSAPDFIHADPASLHSFSVGRGGHPFHRHAGSRVFTAISGSGGALLRFSTASSAQLATDPASFAHALQHVEVPADCLFTVRMAGDTWHQFLPLQDDGRHPALFALSCHPDETAGRLSTDIRARVQQGQATIASLTELLPVQVEQLLQGPLETMLPIATTALGFGSHPCGWCSRLWVRVRRCSGNIRQRLIALRPVAGFVHIRQPAIQIATGIALPTDSLLHGQLEDRHQHQDGVRVVLDRQHLGNGTPADLLAGLLQAFIEQPAAVVSGLMQLRNVVVKPLGLRTSPLGCPVSSLLAEAPAQRFCQRFPVLAQQSDARHAQVLLGADDRHLRFRSCVAIHDDGHQVRITLFTRVRSHNAFGHIYMAVIDPLHRQYIAPTMLAAAVARLLDQLATAPSSNALPLPRLT